MQRGKNRYSGDDDTIRYIDIKRYVDIFDISNITSIIEIHVSHV